MSLASFWGSKVRQFRAHQRARVDARERAGLDDWLSPPQLALFDSMHVADRRHGLDVVATLRAEGQLDEELLLAGLLHDAGKGDTGLWPRVAYSLGQEYGRWIWRVAGSTAGIPRRPDPAPGPRRGFGASRGGRGLLATDGGADPAPGRATGR